MTAAKSPSAAFTLTQHTLTVSKSGDRIRYGDRDGDQLRIGLFRELRLRDIGNLDGHREHRLKLCFLDRVRFHEQQHLHGNYDGQLNHQALPLLSPSIP